MQSTTANQLAPCRDGRGRYTAPPSHLRGLLSYCKQSDALCAEYREIAYQANIRRILNEVHKERDRAARQQTAPAPMEGGADRTGLPAREYYERITGEEVRADGKCKCPNHARHANGDRTPSLWANGGKLRCFSCNMTIRSVQLLAITMDVGYLRRGKWELDEDRPGRARVMVRHAELFPERR